MDIFSKHYDDLVGADYNRILKYILSSIKKYKSDSELVCDLGCGTGKLAIGMSKNGYDMIAIDSNEDMLVKARENIQISNADNILLLNQDITEFELYGTVDVIYSTLDTINYICDKNDLKRLFNLVRNYLNYDGLFIFDINTEYKFKHILNGGRFIYDTDELFCVWESYFDSNSAICEHELTYFENNGYRTYSRYDSFQKQRFYDEKYIKSLIEMYNFEILEFKDNYSQSAPSAKTERYTYVLQTKK